jgi:fibronectin type 3 domain-containing protein
MKFHKFLVALVLLSAGAVLLYANTPGRHSVQLTWNASTSSGANYNVYRGAATGVCSGAPTPFASGISNTSFLDTSVQAGTYYYAVSAFTATGGESTCTAEVQVAVPSITTFPPTNLQGVSN